ncbi:MAG: HAMP domain-containing sensor histidine kinase [Candidatus Eisenbacteria bacterium]
MRNTRVLGVDDNPRNLTILSRTLGPGFDFSTAHSGEEALEHAAGVPPDIVLLDIMMPGIDGYETCRRLRRMPTCAAAKILLVSAKAMTSERLAGYAAGADDYVTKPFDPDELVAKVRVYSRLRTVEELDHLRSSLLTLLGHEARTPLTTIMTPLEMLRSSADMPKAQLALLDMMERGAQRLLTLIEKSQYLSQLMNGKLDFTFTPIDLAVLVTRAIAAQRSRADAHDIRISFDAQPTPLVPVDTQEFGAVLEALLDNALRFTPTGGCVQVRLAAESGHVRLSVHDEGPGVGQDKRIRLFEPFVVDDLKHHAGGLGLGLAIAHELVTAHHGKLTLEDTNGPGARFDVVLPIAAEKAPSRAAA